MSFVNFYARELNCKIVYYGPGLSGKTTNLQYIYQKTNPGAKGKMISLATETERTLFFDFLPPSLEKVRGFTLRFHLYTVPGPIFYDASRKLILKAVDGIVFVADSQSERIEANLESLDNLRTNLAEQGYDLDAVPLVLQYNKQDLFSAMSLAKMDSLLNPSMLPSFAAVANKGLAVFETFYACVGRLLLFLQEQTEASGKKPPSLPTEAAVSPPTEAAVPPPTEAAVPPLTEAAVPPPTEAAVWIEKLRSYVERGGSRQTWLALVELFCESPKTEGLFLDQDLSALWERIRAWPAKIRTYPFDMIHKIPSRNRSLFSSLVGCIDRTIFAPPDPKNPLSRIFKRRAKKAVAAETEADPYKCSYAEIVRVYDETLKEKLAFSIAIERFGPFQNLRELRLGPGITSKGAAALAGAEHLRTLETLDLSRNALGTEGVRVVSQASLWSGLRALHVGRNQLGDDALEALVEKTALRGLRLLDLDCNRFGGRGVSALAASPLLATVETLNLSHNRLTKDGCRALAESPYLSALRVLYLHDCGLSDEDIEPLFNAPWLGGLVNLALSENRLTLASVRAFAATPALGNLEELDICHNGFEEAEASVILQGSPSLRSVRRFCLEKNTVPFDGMASVHSGRS